MTVTEKIGEKYKSWKPGKIYLINAGTGQGKSYFVTNALYEYAEKENKKILLICNRTILKAQFDEILQEKSIDTLLYQELEYLDRQNKLDPIKKQNEDDVKDILNKYDYVVLDEAHYIYSDSAFNKYTDVIEKALEPCNAVIIMLSATPTLLEQVYEGKIEEVCKIKPDYSYIKKVLYYQRKGTIYKLLNAIPEDEKAIVFSSNKQRLKKMHEEYKSDSYYVDHNNKTSSRNNNKLSKPVQQIVEQQTFDRKFLFCTKVLDNGINIKDKAVKHIFIEMDDLIDFVQCLGRKRVLDENDTVTLYFYNYTSHIEQGKYQDLKKYHQIYQESLDLPNDIFCEKYRKEKLPYFFENQYGIIETSFKYFMYRLHFIEKIANKEIYFQDLIAKIVGKRSREIIKYDAPTKDKVLLEYLSKNKGKKLFLNDKQQTREKLIKFFDIQRNNKLVSNLEELNQYLHQNSIPFKISTARETTSNEYRNKYYWVIEDHLGTTLAHQ